MSRRTVTFSEIDQEMKRREQIEKLQDVLRYLISKGNTEMPSSLDSWKSIIKEYHADHSEEWTEAFLVPGPPGGEMITLHPPRKKMPTSVALEFPPTPKTNTDDSFLELMLASDDEDEDEEDEDKEV